MKPYIINTDSLQVNEEQFFKFCVQNSELRIERDINKNLIIMAPTGSDTGHKNFSINVQLGIWNNRYGLGYCFDSSSGFTLPDDSMRSPDAAWIKKERYERVPVEDRKRFAHICPDFVIELRSESDSLKDLQIKMEEWIKNGCCLAWLIDTEDRKVHIYRPGEKVLMVSGFDKTVSGGDVLPGFELDLRDLL